MGKIKKEIYNRELNMKLYLVHFELKGNEAQAIYTNFVEYLPNIKIVYLEKYAAITKHHSRKLRMIQYAVIDKRTNKTLFNSMFDYEVFQFLMTYIDEPEPEHSEAQRADEGSRSLENSEL